jgi:hypothetical protein
VASRALFPLALVLLIGWACSNPANPSTPLDGQWGGDHVSLRVADTGTHFEFDCAHGDMPGALKADGRGNFSEAGTFVREHGGPIRLDEVPDAHPALYAGSVTGNSMTLSVSLTDTRQTIGSFTLARNTTGRVVKCL